MSTANTDTQRDSIATESADAFFTFADDDAAQPTPPPKPVTATVTKPTRKEVEPIAFQPRPKTYAASRDTTPDEPSDWRTTALRCFSVLCFIVGIGMFVKPYFDSPNTTHTSLKLLAASSSQPRVTTRNIEDCELGQRALGKNPLRDQVETLPEPDPETSRKIVLQMRKESGHRLDIQLIRSLLWIESVGAIEDESFYLNMEEMGAVGDAYVKAILPCPPIQKGAGNVITGIFAHEADPETRILSVAFSNGACLKGVTDNHPFWSVDRRGFVEIGEMNEGDWVKTASGLTQITNLDSRYAHSGEMLYNLETHNEHVFQVTLAGILVHNNCAKTAFHGTDVDSALHLLNGGRLDAAAAITRKIDGPDGFFLATHLDDASFFAARRNGTILQFNFSDAARKQLDAAGIIRQPIPGGPKSPNFLGDELMVKPDQFDLFNKLLDSGDISIIPAKF